MTRPSIVIDDRRLARIRKKLGPDITLPPVGRLIVEAGRVAQQEAANRAPSLLASRIQTQARELSAKVSVSHPGARAMESGRKPLAAGGTLPPPSAFAYITSDAGQQFAIARAVARRGTKGRFFMKKAKAKAVRMLPELAAKAAAEIARDWARV